MPAWTLGELMSTATTRIGRRSDITMSTASFYVNMAYQEIAASERHALLETLTVSSTTSGEGRLELPADCMEPISLSWLTTTAVGSAQTLRPTSHANIDAFGAGYGKPSEYAFYNNWIELFPSPDSSYSLQMRYYAYPSDMTATSAVPSLATEWRPAVLYLSEALLHEHVGNELEGANARARYAGYAASLKNTAARRASAGLRASLPLRRSRYGRSGDSSEDW